jgi:hypothetical protein
MNSSSKTLALRDKPSKGRGVSGSKKVQSKVGIRSNNGRTALFAHGWLETSDSEKKLANILAERILQFHKPFEFPIVLESLAISFSGEKSSVDVIRLTSGLESEIKRLNLSELFPHDLDAISSNLFSCLSTVLRSKSKNIKIEGLVSTPFKLAKDLVDSATFYWLGGGNTIVGEAFKRMACRRTKLNNFTVKELRLVQDALSRCRWCDSSVGGGVFVLAILQLLQELKMPLFRTLLKNITAWDIDELSVTATKIRTALFLRGHCNETIQSLLTNPPIQIAQKDALSELRESRDLWAPEAQSFDIFVGNPPYVRSDILPQKIKDQLFEHFPSLSNRNLDLYFYFIGGSLFALAPNGVLSYVTSASFQRSRHGEVLRSLIGKLATPQLVVDFGELPVFQDASVPHTAAYVLKRSDSKNPSKTLAQGLIQTKLTALSFLDQIDESFSVPENNLSSAAWHITSDSDANILEHLVSTGPRLREAIGPVYSGIKTGCSMAYIVSEETKDALCEKTPDAASIFKRILVPTDIKAWKSTFSGSYLLLVKKGDVLDEGSSVYKHLSKYKDLLSKRTDVNGHQTWYGLRQCQYYPLIEKPKLIFPDIATTPRFTIDTERYYLPDGTFFLATEDVYLLGLLNSSVGKFYFQRKCHSIGNPQYGGRLRFKKAYVESFPVPLRESDLKTVHEIEILSKELLVQQNAKKQQDIILELDEIVMRVFRLPKSYMNVIKKIRS